MGNVVSVGVGEPDCQVNRLKRGSFFAHGATVDHGKHLHQFKIRENQVVVRKLKKADENPETTTVTEEETVSREEAYSKYKLLTRPVDGINGEGDDTDCGDKEDIFSLFRVPRL